MDIALYIKAYSQCWSFRLLYFLIMNGCNKISLSWATFVLLGDFLKINLPCATDVNFPNHWEIAASFIMHSFTH